MKNIIKCVNEECGHEEPARGDEYMQKGLLGIKRAVRSGGYMVLCPVCDCQTILIDDKWERYNDIYEKWWHRF